MKTIVITSGGTTEYIDKVRKITNISSGALGTIIANTFLENKNFHIIFICAKNSRKPEITLKNQNRLTIIEIETTFELKNAIEEVLKTHNVDFFIHACAVSDYYVDFVTNSQIMNDSLKDMSIKEYINNPNNKLDNSSKVSSDEENLVVVLKQTPKIIHRIKEISPNTILVGFKLLENVSNEYLLKIARNLMIKNSCDYVIANDLKDIKNGEHIAFLLNNKNENIIKINGKLEIAKQIVQLI